MVKNVIAIALIVFGLFGFGLLDKLDRPLPNPSPAPTPAPEAILVIDRPSDDIINKSKAYSDLIVDPTDRAKIAIFNYQFATNVLNYKTNLQQLNDVYTLAGKSFFSNSLVGKYKDLSTMIVNSIEEITTSENHVLTDEEKRKIHDQFMGIAWVLIQKAE